MSASLPLAKISICFSPVPNVTPPSSCPHSAPHFLSFFYYFFFFPASQDGRLVASHAGKDWQHLGSSRNPRRRAGGRQLGGQGAEPRPLPAPQTPLASPGQGEEPGGEDLSRSSPREALRPGGVGPSLAAKTQLPVLPDSWRFVSSFPRLALTLRFVFIYRRNYFQ